MKYKLYHGHSTYLSLELVNEKVIQERTSTTEVVVIDAENTSAQTLIDTLSSPTLFATNRILLLKRTYRNKEKEKLLEKIFLLLETNQSSDTVLFWEDQKIKANTKYYKFFNKEKKVFESKELNKRTFLTWMKEELKKEGIEIGNDAVRALAERTNYDPERCSNEIKKMKLVIEDNKITRQDVLSLVSNTLENDIWNLIDSINNGDTKQSTEILERLIAQSVDANYIISMISRNLRLITLTKYLLEEKDGTGSIAKILKVPPFTVPSLISSSKKYSNKKIETLYTKLSNLDFQIKKGLIEPNLGLTLLSSIL